mgnify:CR=1 FL=1
MSETTVDTGKRTWLIASGCAGAVGGAAVAVPFISTFSPSERAKAAGAAVEVDISSIKPGEKLTVEWRGKPVWILNRNDDMMATLPKLNEAVADPNSDKPMQPEYCKNEHRSIKDKIWVAIGICTHLGCSPSSKFAAGASQGMPGDWLGGFLCPCHGSTFDIAGRVFKNKPAPDNLEVPPHMYLSDTKLLIGEDKKA